MTDANDQQLPDPDNREWTPVPPPNPYASGQGGAQPGGGKAFAIVAMAFGLAALLTVGVAVSYFDPFFAILGAVVGALALVLGIIALVKRGRPKAAGIVGVVAGSLAILVPVALALATTVLLVSEKTELQPVEETEEWTPDEEQESLIEWPANMATGGVVFERGEGSAPAVRASEPLPAGRAPEASAVDRDDDVADILLYVDYRCPHCFDFEAANGALLEDLVSSGRATLEIVPLSFVDRSYSAPMAGAMICVADGQPEAAWAAHAALFGAEVQVPEPTAEVLVSVLDSAVLDSAATDAAAGGLDPSVRDCIETGRFTPFAQALSTWAFSNPVPNALDTALRVEGTPFAIVNGVPYPGAAEDGEAFARFVDEQTR